MAHAPAWLAHENYQAMLWDSDVYIGAIVNLLKAKAMYVGQAISKILHRAPFT